MPCRAARNAAIGITPVPTAIRPCPHPSSRSILARAASGEIEHDPAQEAAAARLDALNERLANYRLARKSSSLGWLFGNREKTEEPLKGLYIYGEVGRGKTMLMDMFFAACPAHAQTARAFP